MQLKEQYKKESARVQIDREVREGHIKTWSGVLIDPFRPRLDTVRIDDIAHALSLVCRYAGHCNTHYSVAQHSLEVASYLEGSRAGTSMLALMGLLHDAEEAYFGDMSSPLKKHYPDYQKHGKAMRDFVWDKYIPGWRGAPGHYVDMVHKADQDMYQIERISQLFPYEEQVKLLNEKYGWRPIINATSHTEMESQFLREFTRLGAKERIPVEGGGAVSPQSNAERATV